MAKKRRQRGDPFQKALTASEAVLNKKLKERAEALASLSVLNREIPALIDIVRALGAKLHPSKVIPATTVDATVAAPEIPPEILAQLPPDDLSNFGSIPAKRAEADAEDEVLPEIEGKALTEES